ncbi:ATP-binding cassette domain-containing protein [Streptosporangium algeriense]|uniref:ATP-binding cassette domain-containing protein n=1 Tax=Streptosporangium algeriense TaxID=1682748 RepID=A0ABW3DT50_9ACTN
MIDLHGITKRHGTLTALDNVDLHFGPGLVALLGRNGAGKSTLLSLMAGLALETSGVLELENRSLGRRRSALRAAVTLLPQDLSLDPRATAAELVDYLLRLRGRSVHRVAEMFELFGLGTVARRPLGELSGGTRQRVGLAYACAADTPILLLDEPTQGLDPWERLTLMRHLAEAGSTKTIVCSTHILSDAEQIASRLVVLHDGRVAFDGSAEKLIAAAPPLYELRCEHHDLASLREQGTIVRVARDEHGHYTVRWTPGDDRPPPGTAVEPTLQDAYLALHPGP